ncbi:MAG: hypothetical protein KBD24_01270, partial [Candidatus Pacebacteria bacterium]|nr:hypothetical protein [Candidatus Paceibacterota bacterium]
LVLILAAYLLIDVIMKSLLAGGEGKVNTYGPWNEILCKNFENKYTVPPLGTITLKPEELVLSPYQDGVDCKVLIGVCNVLCPVNTEVRWGTSCEKNIADKKCCVPIESSNICKMSDGSAGGCQSFDFCLDNAEINPACGTTGLVCCPSKDFEKSGDMVGACEGKDMINAPKWSGHVSCACGNAISMNTVNGVNELFNEYGNKVLVTSLTCESHLSQAHPSGIAADLEDSTGMKGIVTTTWTKIPNATWSDGTEVYEKQGGSIRCAVESNHLHCEFVTFDQTRNRK